MQTTKPKINGTHPGKDYVPTNYVDNLTHRDANVNLVADAVSENRIKFFGAGERRKPYLVREVSATSHCPLREVTPCDNAKCLGVGCTLHFEPEPDHYFCVIPLDVLFRNGGAK
jgi:hypothetical protein